MPARTKKAQEQVGTSAAGGAGSKAAAMSGASTVMDTAAHPDLVLPLCQLSLPEYGRPRALQWNAHGQALVVTETVCYILTPSMGYHPLLKPNQPSFVEADSLLDVADGIASSKSASANTPAGAPDFTGKPKPMDFFGSGIDLPSFQAVKASKTHDRAVDSQDYDAVNPGVLGTIYKEATWSPPGLGTFDSCLLAVVDTNCDVKIIAAASNPVLGPWTTVEALNCSEGVKAKSKPRFKALADQAVSIAWSPALREPSALLAVGTRSGEVVLWHRSAADPIHKYAGRVQVGSAAVTSVAWSEHVEQRDGRQVLRLAVVLPSGPRIIDVGVDIEASTDVGATLSDVQPPSLPDVPHISLIRFIGESLLIATPGQVRLWHATSTGADRVWQSCYLAVDEEREDTTDPCAPAVSAAIVRMNDEPRLLQLTLASRLEYHVPLSPLPSTTLPAASVSSQKSLALSPKDTANDLIADLARQVEAQQSLLGHCAGSDGRVIAIVETEGDTAAFRVRLDRSCRLSLILRLANRGDDDGDNGERPQPLRLLQRLLKDVESADSKVQDATPIQLFRPVLALYYASTSALQKTFLLELLKMTASGEEGNDDNAGALLRRLWLAQRLQREARAFQPWSEPLVAAVQSVKDVESRMRIRAMAQWVSGEVKAVSAHQGDLAAEDQKYLRRLVVVACWLQSRTDGLEASGVDAVARRVALDPKDVDSWRKGTHEADLSEQCPACESPVGFARTATNPIPTWMQCPSGHVFKRCSLTFDILASAQVRTCEGCWSKSSGGGGEATPSPSLVASALRRSASRCLFCGCRWLALV